MSSFRSENLAAKNCIPCRGGVPPLRGAELEKLQDELGNGWQVVREHHLEKEYSFPDFRQALDFTVRLGAVAEAEGHHPDIYLAWGKVRLQVWTHKIEGLTESDFILAAKADQLLRS
jgi:4a-hydroxytetrahydrobiopterin dehydratase